MRKISGLFGVLILSIGLMSCGGGGDGSVSPPPPPPPPPPPTCATGTFCMGSATFLTANSAAQPVSLTVAANTAVTWNNDSGGTPHNVIFDDAPSALAVGNGSGGNIPDHTTGSNQRQFATAGNHPFHCSIHGSAGSGMRGVVVVQ